MLTSLSALAVPAARWLSAQFHLWALKGDLRGSQTLHRLFKYQKVFMPGDSATNAETIL